MKEEYREKAEQEYLKSIGIIFTLMRIRGDKNSKGRAYASTMDEFESALQGIMLYALINDGKIGEEAIDMLNSIAVTGDILKRVNSVGKRRYFKNWVPVTWENINDFNRPVKEIQEILVESVSAAVLSFIEPIAVSDRDIASRSFIDDLAQSVESMLNAVCHFEKEDGDSDKVAGNVEAGMKLFNEIFKSHWQHYKNKEILNKGIHHIYFK